MITPVRIVAGISGLLLLAILVYGTSPQLVFSGGSTGRGVSALLSPGDVIEQPLTFSLQPGDALFLALDTPENARHIILESIGRGRRGVLITDEKEIPGATWNIPRQLPDMFPDTARFTLAAGADPVGIVADERSSGSSDKAVFQNENNAEPLALSVAVASEQPRWALMKEEQRQMYAQAAWIISVGSLAVLLLIGLGALVKHKQLPMGFTAAIVVVLIALAAGIRLWFAARLPLVNDEQFYIFDAILYNPQDPHFWKTPLLINALAGWIRVIGVDALLPLRLLVILSAVAALGILARIAYHLAGKTAGWATLGIAFFSPVVISYSSLIMTEQFMLLPAVGAAMLAIKYRQKSRLAWWCLLLISLLLALAAAVRWSAVFWFLAVALLLRTSSLREFGRRVTWLAAPFAAVGAGFVAAFPDILSKFRISQMVVEFFEQSQAQGWFAKLKSWWQSSDRLIPLLLPAAGLIIPRYKLRALLDVIAFLIPPLVAYAIFHKVNAKYLAELMPALVLISGLGFASLLRAVWNNRIAAVVALLGISFLTLLWADKPLTTPYSGTISLRTLRRAVEYLKTNVASNERILTGSSLVPLMAGKQPAYPISHPSWLEPTFRGEVDPRYENQFGPIANDIEAGKIEWVLDGKLTTDTYRRHPRIDAAINSLYEVVVEIPNENSRPLTILRLKP